MRIGVDTVRIKAVLAPEGPASLSIGRGRVAERGPQGLTLKLHDKPIFRYDGKSIVLDLCGMWTPSTTKAMREYGDAVGVAIKPSLAKGRFTASYRGTVHEANFNNTIRIEI
jgi:hypothetical protein